MYWLGHFTVENDVCWSDVKTMKLSHWFQRRQELTFEYFPGSNSDTWKQYWIKHRKFNDGHCIKKEAWLWIICRLKVLWKWMSNKETGLTKLSETESQEVFSLTLANYTSAQVDSGWSYAENNIMSPDSIDKMVDVTMSVKLQWNCVISQ